MEAENQRHTAQPSECLLCGGAGQIGTRGADGAAHLTDLRPCPVCHHTQPGLGDAAGSGSPASLTADDIDGAPDEEYRMEQLRKSREAAISAEAMEGALKWMSKPHPSGHETAQEWEIRFGTPMRAKLAAIIQSAIDASTEKLRAEPSPLHPGALEVAASIWGQLTGIPHDGSAGIRAEQEAIARLISDFAEKETESWREYNKHLQIAFDLLQEIRLKDSLGRDTLRAENERMRAAVSAVFARIEAGDITTRGEPTLTSLILAALAQPAAPSGEKA